MRQLVARSIHPATLHHPSALTQPSTSSTKTQLRSSNGKATDARAEMPVVALAPRPWSAHPRQRLHQRQLPVNFPLFSSAQVKDERIRDYGSQLEFNCMLVCTLTRLDLPGFYYYGLREWEAGDIYYQGRKFRVRSETR